MTASPSDAELVRRIGTGHDRDAETDLCHRLGRRIRLYGLRHLRNNQAADDLAQEVLITTLQALRSGRLRDPEKLTSFVLGTCRITVLDLRRGTRRRARLLATFGTTGPPVAAPSTLLLDRGRLVHCLEGLSERERTVVVLTFYDERTASDVGTFLGISAVNVRVIRHRALRRLRECMVV